MLVTQKLVSEKGAAETFQARLVRYNSTKEILVKLPLRLPKSHFSPFLLLPFIKQFSLIV